MIVYIICYHIVFKTRVNIQAPGLSCSDINLGQITAKQSQYVNRDIHSAVICIHRVPATLTKSLIHFVGSVPRLRLPIRRRHSRTHCPIGQQFFEQSAPPKPFESGNSSNYVGVDSSGVDLISEVNGAEKLRAPLFITLHSRIAVLFNYMHSSNYNLKFTMLI